LVDSLAAEVDGGRATVVVIVGRFQLLMDLYLNRALSILLEKKYQFS
jgi:hypothetical protein